MTINSVSQPQFGMSAYQLTTPGKEITAEVASKLQQQGRALVDRLGGYEKATTFPLRNAEGKITGQAVLDGPHHDAYQAAINASQEASRKAHEFARTILPEGEARTSYEQNAAESANKRLDEIRQTLIDNPFELPPPKK